MKYNYIIAALTTVSVLAGCSEETFLPENTTTGKEVIVGASLDQSTRLAFTEEQNGDVTVTWTAGDYLNVIDDDHNQVTRFNLTSGQESTIGKFAGTPAQPYTNAQELHALFSKNPDAPVTIDNERKGIYIDLSGQDGTLNEKYQYMFGTTVYHEGRDVNFALTPLVSVIKANFTLPSGVTTITNVTFSDLSNSYRSNAYLMLEDGTYGYSQYNVGDLLRKGEEYVTITEGEYQYRNLDKPAEPYDKGITLNGDFTANENNQFSAYFYVMRTIETYRDNNLVTNQDNKSLSDNSYMHPLFLLTDTSGELYIAQVENGKSVQPGNIYELSVNQLNPVASIPVGQEAYVEDGNCYAFTPTVSGVYSLYLLDRGWYSNIGYNLVGNERPQDDIYEAGKTYVFRSSNTERVILRCRETRQTVNVNEVFDFEGSNDVYHTYYFTPSETGMYTLQGWENSNYWMNIYGENGGVQEMSGSYYLIKDNVYEFNFSCDDDQTYSVKWVKSAVNVISLKEGENTISMPAPTDENINDGIFMFSTDKNAYFKISGFYNFNRISGGNWIAGFNDVIYIETATNQPTIIQSDSWRWLGNGQPYTYKITIEEIVVPEVPAETNYSIQEGTLYNFKPSQDGFYIFEGIEKVADFDIGTAVSYNYNDGGHLFLATQSGTIRFSEKTVIQTIETGVETTVSVNEVYKINYPEDADYNIEYESGSSVGAFYGFYEHYTESSWGWYDGELKRFNQPTEYYFIPRSDGKITIEKVNY